MVTVKDIANAAGVSRYTASKVINNAPGVTPETRELVLKTCRELGYIPNLNAISLVRGNSNLIGVIVPYITDGFYSMLLEEMEKLFSAAGFQLIYKSSYNETESESKAITALLSLKVEALLIVPVVKEPDLEMHALAEKNTHVIYLDRPLSDECYSILNDNFQSAVTMTNHLLTKSKDVVFLDSFYGADNPAALERRRGYETAMKEHGLTPRIIPAGNSSVMQDNEYYAWEKLSAFFSSGKSCGAIFCVTDAAAFGAARAAREAGFTPGKDIFIGGHDNLRFGAFAQVPLTTMAQPVAGICQEALKMVKLLTSGKTPQKKKIVLPSQLVVRG
ncbi:MAG: LacI family DNA-binding transcriptional regulator [Lentisphaeria bacterium]|nr:LacI family DNA-binding transcriptional regulator [Lentisphaeria bacterium]